MTGAELRKLREDRGVKASWVADRMGLKHRQQINKIENKKDVSVDEFVAYTAALDLKAGDLLPNSIGADLLTYMPIVEQLRKTDPANLDALQVMISTAIATFDANYHRGLMLAPPSTPPVAPPGEEFVTPVGLRRTMDDDIMKDVPAAGGIHDARGRRHPRPKGPKQR